MSKIMKICRLCMVRLPRGSRYFNLNDWEAYSRQKSFKEQLSVCLPELDLDLLPSPVICNVCRQTLRLAYEFKKRCLQVEEKIRTYAASNPLGENSDLSHLATFDNCITFNTLSYALLNKNKQKKNIKINNTEAKANNTTTQVLEAKSDIAIKDVRCNKIFNNAELLRNHQMENHTKNENNSGNGPSKKPTAANSDLKKIILERFFTDEAPDEYKCNFCNLTFKTLQMLRKHNTYCRSCVKSRKPLLPTNAKNHMKRWLFKHTEHPYPTDQEKQQLMKDTNLSLLQVENWFINARRRILLDLAKLKESDSELKQMCSGGDVGCNGNKESVNVQVRVDEDIDIKYEPMDLEVVDGVKQEILEI